MEGTFSIGLTYKWLKNANIESKDKKDLVLEICKVFFKSQYGKESLNNIGILDEETNNRIDDYIKFKMDERLNFIYFSKLYEDFLMDYYKEKTGTFYTPIHIVDYMVQRSLVIYLSKKTGICEKLLQESMVDIRCLTEQNAIKVVEAVDQVKIIDIACGTGLFLIRCLEKIYQYKKMLYAILQQKMDSFSIKQYIIENNLFGIDIQKQPTLIAKMILASIAYDADKKHKGCKINFNILVGNSLTQRELFTEGTMKSVILKHMGFDIVISNPPYIGEKGNKDIFDYMRSTEFGRRYYEGKMDYFYYFIYRGLELLKANGILSYITTNYFVTADGAVKLRKHLKNECTFIDIINFNEYEIFKSAKGQHNMIFFLTKGLKSNQHVQIKSILDKNISSQEMYCFLYRNQNIKDKTFQCIIDKQDKLYNENGHILIQQNVKYDTIINKIERRRSCTLGSICNINQGLVSGADKVTKEMLEKKFSIKTRKEVKLNQGIFVLNEKEVKEMSILDSPFLKPMFKNSDIQRYVVNDIPEKYILYILDNSFEHQEENSIILKHLEKFKEILAQRRETIRGLRKWYALQWPRKQALFEGLKIVAPHRAKVNKFALNESPWYASADVYFITAKNKKVDLHLILSQLNSKIMYFWLYNRGKRKGQYLELYANPLKQLPIILEMDNKKYQKLVYLTSRMIEQGEQSLQQRCIDQLLYDEYRLTNTEIKIIEDLYEKNCGK